MAVMRLSRRGYFTPLYLEYMRLGITSWPMASSTNGGAAI